MVRKATFLPSALIEVYLMFRNWKSVFFVGFLLVLIAGLVRGCWISNEQLEEIALNNAKYFIELPSNTTELHAYYAGMLQARDIFIKFHISKDDFEDFLSKTCFGDMSALSSKDIRSLKYRYIDLPEWW